MSTAATSRELRLTLCPSCGGRDVEVGACRSCQGAGVLDELGAPFHAPAPFDTWTPAALVALSESSRSRSRHMRARQLHHDLGEIRLTRDEHDTPVAVRKARHLTLSEIVELQLAALAKVSGEHSTISIDRKSKGEVHIGVSVRTGEGGIETVEEARMKAEEQFSHLCTLYPPSQV